MSNLDSSRGKWGSKIGFIVAAAGSAIGLGNIWRFPYVAGENGGAAFVLIYIVFVFLIGLPVMIAELSIGRNTQKNPVGAFKKLFPKSHWKIAGGIGVLTGIGILSFYAVIAGWTLQYAVKSITTPNYIKYTEADSVKLWQEYILEKKNIIFKDILAKDLKHEKIDDIWNEFSSTSEFNLLFQSTAVKLSSDLSNEEFEILWNDSSTKKIFARLESIYQKNLVGKLENQKITSIWNAFLTPKAFHSFKEKKIGQLHTEKLFTNFVGNSYLPIFYLLIFIGLTVVVVMGGVSAGIERWSKILMPILLILLVVLAIRSITLDGAKEGLQFYLQPDFSKIKLETFARALGQAFFSLSLGMGTMITYGSYISRRDNLVTSASSVVLFDTLIAILAGLVMFPALFAMGMDPAGGTGLVFVVLPSIFAKMPGGMFFGAGIFLLLSIAALTSTISLLEVPVAYLVDDKGWSRKKATLFMGLAAALLGIPSALSIGASSWLSEIPFLKIGFLDFMNAFFGNYSLSVGSLLIAIFAGYKWGVKAVQREIEQEGNVFKLKLIWAFLIRFICPIAVVIILGYIIVTQKYF